MHFDSDLHRQHTVIETAICSTTVSSVTIKIQQSSLLTNKLHHYYTGYIISVIQFLNFKFSTKISNVCKLIQGMFSTVTIEIRENWTQNMNNRSCLSFTSFYTYKLSHTHVPNANIYFKYRSLTNAHHSSS